MSKTENISIRQVTNAEVGKLQEIGKVTFFESFGADNTLSDIEQYLSESFSLARLQSELDHPASQFFFAELNHEVVGYLKVNTGKAQTESVLDYAIEIERIYVLSKFQGRNIGKLLLEKALEIAEAEKAERIWLGVWEKNAKAIRFYRKNGFTEFGKHSFKLGSDEQTDIMMTLELIKTQR